jgi:hypothetical protein
MHCSYLHVSAPTGLSKPAIDVFKLVHSIAYSGTHARTSDYLALSYSREIKNN